MDRRALRRHFVAKLWIKLRVVWPILSVMLLIILGLGVMAGAIEGWSVGDSLYFSFVTGLTIGYGDLVPKTGLARVLAALIGVLGILYVAIVAAVAVTALEELRGEFDE